VTLVVVSATLLSVALMVVTTLPDFRLRAMRHETGPMERAFKACEVVIVAVFAVDYFVRLLTASAMRQVDYGVKPEAAAADGAPLPSSDGAAVEGSPGSLRSPELSPINPMRARLGGDSLQSVDSEDGNSLGRPSGGPPRWCTCRCNSVAVTMTAWATLRYALRPLSLVDLASFLPFFFELAADSSNDIANTSVLRVVRIVRVLLLFKIAGRTDGFQVVMRTLRSSMGAVSPPSPPSAWLSMPNNPHAPSPSPPLSPLQLLLLVVYGLILCVFFSCLIFFCESGEYDAASGLWMRWSTDGSTREPTPYLSIIHTAYFTVVALTTTGLVGG